MTPREAEGGCPCGQVRFWVSGTPLFRAYCHCNTCQDFNQAERADIIVMQRKDVTLEGHDEIDFRYYQRPPIIRRGKCGNCRGVAIEEINLPLIPKLVIIPAQTLLRSNTDAISQFHMFYHRRVRDSEDDLPKYSTYMTSQFGFAGAVLKRLAGRRANP